MTWVKAPWQSHRTQQPKTPNSSASATFSTSLERPPSTFPSRPGKRRKALISLPSVSFPVLKIDSPFLFFSFHKVKKRIKIVIFPYRLTPLSGYIKPHISTTLKPTRFDAKVLSISLCASSTSQSFPNRPLQNPSWLLLSQCRSARNGGGCCLWGWNLHLLDFVFPLK